MMMVVLPPGGMRSRQILGAGAVLGIQQEIGRSDESTYDHDVCLPTVQRLPSNTLSEVTRPAVLMTRVHFSAGSRQIAL